MTRRLNITISWILCNHLHIWYLSQTCLWSGTHLNINSFIFRIIFQTDHLNAKCSLLWNKYTTQKIPAKKHANFSCWSTNIGAWPTLEFTYFLAHLSKTRKNIRYVWRLNEIWFEHLPNFPGLAQRSSTFHCWQILAPLLTSSSSHQQNWWNKKNAIWEGGVALSFFLRITWFTIRSFGGSEGL